MNRVKKEMLWIMLCMAMAIGIGLALMPLWNPARGEFLGYLRQSTQKVVQIGQLVDFNDAITPETDFDVSTSDVCELLKSGSATVVDMSGVSLVDIPECNGAYTMTLTTSHTDTLGPLTYFLGDTSIIAPYRATWMVVGPNAYDRDYANDEIDVYSIKGAAPLSKGTIADEVQTHMDANSVLANGTYGLAAIQTETAAILVDTETTIPNWLVANIGTNGTALTELPELVWEDPNATAASPTAVAEAVWEDANALTLDTAITSSQTSGTLGWYLYKTKQAIGLLR